MPLRFSLAAILLLFAGSGHAEWTGIHMELGDIDYQWEFDNDEREAQISKISFSVEEKTTAGLRIGIVFGYLDMRVVADTPAASEKFDGNYLSLYLRQPYQLSDHLSLHGAFTYSYHTGDESGDEDDEQSTYDWSEASFRLGFGLRYGNLRVLPYVEYTDIDGDISGDNGTETFSVEEPQSQGIRFDYFIDDSAFIRLEFIDGGQDGGYLTFARRF